SSTFPFCFFFSSYGHPRDLHSFPTRRSSDLVRQRDGIGVDLDDAGQEIRHDLAGGAIWHVQDVDPRLRLEGLADQMTIGADARGDRKSTRLNSSHVAISYAVFCLKKKKTKKK